MFRLKCVSVITAISLPQFDKSVVSCSTAPGLDKAAALSTYSDGTYVEILWATDFSAGCRVAKLRFVSALFTSDNDVTEFRRNELFIGGGLFPVITGMAPFWNPLVDVYLQTRRSRARWPARRPRTDDSL